MRSELVYRASDKVQNRFELCRLASFSARNMNRNSVAMHITINQALEAIGAQSVLFAAEVPHIIEVKAADEAGAIALSLDPAV
jgi:hypothetical protein